MTTRGGARPRIGLGRLVGYVLFFLALTLVAAEGLLQVGALVMRDRSADGWRPGATFHVLAVGDSHTHGGGVPADESYPGQLQRLLDEQEPGAYSVINLGVPGMNTAQVRNRLPRHVGRYHPDLVVVWCGMNDGWNPLEQELSRSGWANRLDGLAMRLRLYKLARVWMHDLELERDGAGPLARPGTQRLGGGKHAVRYGDVVEHIEGAQEEWNAAVHLERVQRNFEEMLRWAHAAHVPIVLITYPTNLRGFNVANRAIRDTAERYGAVAVIDSSASIKRVPPERRKFRWAMHPNGDMYREIARDLLPIVTRLRAAQEAGAGDGY